MSAIPTALLVDTNVWLDYYLGSRPRHEAACALIRKVVEKDVGLYIAYASIKDLFYLIGSSVKRRIRDEKGVLGEEDALVSQSIAWSCINHLAELATPVAADASDAFLARTYRCINSDYEDNTIIAAAQRAKATIVTADEQLISISPAPALSIDCTIALLDAG